MRRHQLVDSSSGYASKRFRDQVSFCSETEPTDIDDNEYKAIKDDFTDPLVDKVHLFENYFKRLEELDKTGL